MTIQFDDRVAIVTGAGNGLGRSHALELARRGARVVVNDLGGDRTGSGGSSDAAKKVVAEIEAAGGEALANGANVASPEEVDAMVAETVARWGRIDILINNAGILRDKTFAKMTLAEFSQVVDVHLLGSVICTKAVWETMREQSYGRILMTTSSSGLYGNFGQTNYGAAKLGVIGLMNTLHLEGMKYDIRVNALAPTAATRMTEDLMPKEVLALLRPETVTPGVIFLVSDEAPSRQILAAGGGGFARAAIVESGGIFLKPDVCTAENVASAWAQLADIGEAGELQAGAEQTMKMLSLASEALGIKLQ